MTSRSLRKSSKTRTNRKTRTKVGSGVNHKRNKKQKRGGKKTKKTFKLSTKKRMTGGCVGPYEMCNFYHQLKYTNDYNSDILGGHPKTVDPSPVNQPFLGGH